MAMCRLAFLHKPPILKTFFSIFHEIVRNQRRIKFHSHLAIGIFEKNVKNLRPNFKIFPWKFKIWPPIFFLIFFKIPHSKLISTKFSSTLILKVSRKNVIRDMAKFVLFLSIFRHKLYIAGNMSFNDKNQMAFYSIFFIFR